MEYFVYYDDGQPWMSVRSFGDNKTAAHDFIKNRFSSNPENNNITGCKFLSILHGDGGTVDVPALILCDCSIKSEFACYDELYEILVSSK